jgi:hypothetical protein
VNAINKENILFKCATVIEGQDSNRLFRNGLFRFLLYWSDFNFCLCYLFSLGDGFGRRFVFLFKSRLPDKVNQRNCEQANDGVIKFAAGL